MSWWVEREKSKCQSSDESIWKTYKMIYKNSYTNIKSLKCSKSRRVDESMWRPETLINDLQKIPIKEKGHTNIKSLKSRWVVESKSRRVDVDEVNDLKLQKQDPPKPAQRGNHEQACTITQTTHTHTTTWVEESMSSYLLEEFNESWLSRVHRKNWKFMITKSCKKGAYLSSWRVDLK